jgi:hypothetical protein
LVDASSRLKAFEVKLDGNMITIGARSPITQPVGMSMTYQSLFKQNVPPIAFLGKRVESWIPIELWSQALFYFVATLPDVPGEKAPPVFFNVTVKWNIPEGNKSARFRVRTIATNTSTPGIPPALTASIAVDAEKVVD